MYSTEYNNISQNHGVDFDGLGVVKEVVYILSLAFSVSLI